MTCVLDYKAGSKIKTIDMLIKGNNGAAGGSVKIRRMQWVTGTGNTYLNELSDVYDIGGTDPFNTSDDWNRVTKTSVDVTIEEGYTYYVVIVSSSGGANEDRMGGFAVKAQEYN